MSRNDCIRLALAILLLALLMLGTKTPTTAQAAPGNVTMTITPLLQGHVKYGEWLVLRVHLANRGDDLMAEVQAFVTSSSGQTVYAASVPLPAAARKQVDVYVLPSSFVQAVTVRLVEGEQVLAEAQVDITTHPQSEYLIGALTADPAAFAALNGLTFPQRSGSRLLPLSLDQLPERAEALRSIDCLILSGVDTSALTPAQGEAIQGWVEGGGRLLIGGGAGARRTLSGLPPALQIAQVSSSAELSALDELADFVLVPIQVPGPFLAALPSSYEGQAVIGQEQPLLVQKTLGNGWVAYLALDPAASPFNAWAGMLPFWQKLLEPGSALPSNVPVDIPARALEAEQMNYALSNLPALDLPSIRWLGLLLGLYIVLVGPLNYLVLRRLRHLDWAWITIPVLTLVFSLTGYGLGYQLRGSDVIINQISIIPLANGSSRAPARTYIGLFSPSRQQYSVEVSGNALISPLSIGQAMGWDSTSSYYSSGSSTLNVLQGNPALVRNLGVNQWAMQTFQAESWIDTSDIAIEADLAFENHHVRGTLRNRTGRPLHDILLISGRRFARLGDADIDEEIQVSVPLHASNSGATLPWALFESYYQGPTPPPREITQQQGILEAYFHTNWGPPGLPSGITIMAWTDLAPVEAQIPTVRAAHFQTTLLVAQLPLPVHDNHITLPPGVVTAQVIEYQDEAGECGPNGYIYLANGRAVLEFRLPAALQGVVIDSLALTAVPDSGFFGRLPTLSIYDWTADGWAQIGSVTEGQPYQIPQPQRFISPTGNVIRVQLEQGHGGCLYVDLGLEGEIPSP